MSKLKELLPEQGDVLVEVFSNDYNLILKTDYKKYYINHTNVFLSDFNQSLASIDLELLETQYNKLEDKFIENNEFFNKVKDMYFEKYDTLDDFRKATLFIFLFNHKLAGFNKDMLHADFNEKALLDKETYKTLKSKNIVFTCMLYKDFIKEVLNNEKEEDINVFLKPEEFKNDELNRDIKNLYKNKEFNMTIQCNYKTDSIMRYYNDYDIHEIVVEDEKTEVIIVKDNRYKASRDFELKILINWLKDKDYDAKIIRHYEKELRNVK